ncbi:keratin, type I cytoskeletal 19-like [Carassius auratus]|uniref:Keratin, type I cytoskeletal 19-like n=1 Tax=Carassius auratus TaxID=7957 RepID=A0A6P6L2L2_CARAU|nr:keratin, type I cytoskeletal 19-like [Carassius auratus]
MAVCCSSKMFTTRSVIGSSGLGSSSGLVMNGLGSSGASLSFSGKSYGSTGGFGAHISRSLSTSSLTMDGYEDTLNGNKKQTMQNLNDRLASYLEQVRSLEQANKKLELQIKEFYDKVPMQSKDMSAYFKTILELRTQINSRYMENDELRLKLDNAKLTADDFQLKCETEMNLRVFVEADSVRLHRVLGEIKLATGDLENQLTELKEELMDLKKSHEEDLQSLQQSGSVNVEIDCVSKSDLDMELQEMRAQYEKLIEKNRREAERWFQSKGEVLQTQVTSSYTEVKTSQTELTDLKRSSQSLEIELQGLLTMKQNLEQSLADVSLRNADQLSQLQLRIDHLQEELQKLSANIQQQASEYQILLDIKMRLEMEIAEYRRLLDGEDHTIFICTSEPYTTETETETVTETVENVKEEEQKSHRQVRKKIIEEQLVDGKVVSSSVEEQIEEID